MRALILVAGAALALAGCNNNDAGAENNLAVDNLTADNLVIDNATVVDNTMDANLVTDNNLMVGNDLNTVDTNDTANTTTNM